MIFTSRGGRFMVQPGCFYGESFAGEWIAMFWWKEEPVRPEAKR